MGLLSKTVSFGTLLWHAPRFLCTIESPKITISRLFCTPREDLIIRMRDHEKLGSYSKLRTLQ